jgi:hypothetical protein
MDCWQGSNAETRHFLSFPFLSFSASALPCRHLVFLLTSSFPCRSFLLITRFRWPLPTSLSRTHFSSSLLCGLRPGSLHHKNKNKASHLLSSPFRTFMLTTRIQPIEQPTSGPYPVVCFPPPWKSMDCGTQYQRRHATLSPSRLWVEDESNVWREPLLQGADPSSMDCSNAETRHFIFPSLRSLMLLPSPLSSSCSFADRRGV